MRLYQPGSISDQTTGLNTQTIDQFLAKGDLWVCGATLLRAGGAHGEGFLHHKHREQASRILLLLYLRGNVKGN